ncbi:sialic acid-binding Ig-like lectin 14 [Garra rufa]|uniref:sialic acid-binding Ig-like lectin 14 n=1 Tax=Garra rufa TaxID=137080 RepID=UPI003CCEE3F3
MDMAEKIFFFSFLLQGVCCRDFSISLQEKIEALSGSCVIINCRFEINETYDKDLTERATGLWLKDGFDFKKKVVFNPRESSQNSFIKGNITGKLKDKNCTTVFYDLKSNHNGKYYFRIETEGKLKETFTQTSVSMNVIESPRKPTVQLYVEQKEVQDQEEVLEGSSVSLRCSAETLCSSPPPTLTWSSTPRIPFSESSRLQELILISDLNFTATHHQHRVTFTCTITYQLHDKNKTAQNNITLHVQYAPKISSSCSCIIRNVSVYVCEVDGNPSPELEWHLSGRPVTNSSNTFISEERLSSTGLRSSITLHQSLSHTSTLKCVSKNIHGNASQLFLLLPPVKCLNHSSVLIEVAVGALVVLTMCAITYTYVRKQNMKLLQARSEDATKSILTNEAALQENQGDPVSVMTSSAEATTTNQESVIYSSIDFTNSKPRELAKTESSMGESSRAREVQVIVSEDVITKQIGSKQSEEELLVDSSQLYATVQRRNP